MLTALRYAYIQILEIEILNFNADATVRAKMVKIDGSWVCTDCNFMNTVNVVYKHIEANHVEVTFYCNVCHKSHKNRASLLTHKSRSHKNLK